MGDIQYWGDKFAQEVDAVRNILSSIPSIKDDMEKQAALDQAERSIREASNTKKSYKMEIRIVNDPTERRRYESELTRHEDALASLSNDVKAIKDEMARGQLFVGADTTGGVGSPEETGDALLNDASKLQDKTQTSLDNTRAMVAESKQVGMETMDELRRQREQIQRIDDEAKKMEDSLARADKLVKTFGRRMATDKFIQCFACVNILLLVGVIVYAVFKGQGMKFAPKPPPSPVRRMLRGLALLEEDYVE